MPILQIKDLHFTYPEGEAEALSGIHWEAKEGTFTVIGGRSGSGKSTLLTQLKTELAPSGERRGQILFCAKPLESYSVRQQSQAIGYVFQDPDAQLVTDKVWHEIAFGLESLGYSPEAMRLRTAEMAAYFGIADQMDRKVNTLSGGQKQLVNLASVMAMSPDLLLLDEPTAQLDPVAAADFLDTVWRIHRELGTTVVMAEQRMEDIMGRADTVMIMEKGQIAAIGTPEEVGQKLGAKGDHLFTAMPSAMRIFHAVEHPETRKNAEAEKSAESEALPSKNQGSVPLSAEKSADKKEGLLFAKEPSILKYPVDVAGGRRWLAEKLSGCSGSITAQDVGGNRESAFSDSQNSRITSGNVPVAGTTSADVSFGMTTSADILSAGSSAENMESSKKNSPKNFFKKVQQPAPCLRARELSFSYQKKGEDILSHFSLDVACGEIFALLGGNGSGKSTALKTFAGIHTPQSGNIRLWGKNIGSYTTEELYTGGIGYLPQEVNHVFSQQTVQRELESVLSGEKNFKVSGQKTPKAFARKAPNKQKNLQGVNWPAESFDRQAEFSGGQAESSGGQAALGTFEDVVAAFGLSELLNRHPYDLSGGEKQRAALAKIFLLHPRLLLLDEPTKGMDSAWKARFGQMLRESKKAGITTVLVSHDLEFCAQYCDRAGLAFEGRITGTGTAQDFFSGNQFYTTATNRMVRQYFPRAVTVEQAVTAIKEAVNTEPDTGTEPDKSSPDKSNGSAKSIVLDLGTEAEKSHTRPDSPVTEPGSPDSDKSGLEKSPRSPIFFWKRAYLISLPVVTPLVIWMGMAFFDDRRYLAVSLFIALYAIIPPFLFFERGRVRVQNLVVIATLSALAVAVRALFYMFPSVKPLAAVVVVAGVGLGAESGFLVGALSMLASNMLFGQGPWTPWQMFSMGLIGLLAGLFFHRKMSFQPKSAVAKTPESKIEEDNKGSTQMTSGKPLRSRNSCKNINRAFLKKKPAQTAGREVRQGSASHNTEPVKKLQNRRQILPLCVYSFFAVIFLYGVIMNIASLTMVSYSVNRHNLLALELSGLPMDTIHALTTVIFLFFFANPMLEKIERVRKKMRR